MKNFRMKNFRDESIGGNRQIAEGINSSLGNPKTTYYQRKNEEVAAYDLANPWSDYDLDQAVWRVSLGIGTAYALEQDRRALAAQRPSR
jgi:hypothetical protein